MGPCPAPLKDRHAPRLPNQGAITQRWWAGGNRTSLMPSAILQLGCFVFRSAISADSMARSPAPCSGRWWARHPPRRSTRKSEFTKRRIRRKKPVTIKLNRFDTIIT
ncbi:hypothetical protein K490DRAFT_60244 [Saccharata proteae CBS 121410]|uniref:Uncharacterized protein n=1 Tax=Saccharata proteae CBS 121410 TaxID=1314787 RepID=A0A9P4HQD5_9PEZI|nr:hypothetical protein K490DRAFT_60244 [Saccharata proteae CBS 121410]